MELPNPKPGEAVCDGWRANPKASASSSLVVDRSALVLGEMALFLGEGRGDLGDLCLRLLRLERDRLLTMPGGSCDRSSKGGRCPDMAFTPQDTDRKSVG